MRMKEVCTRTGLTDRAVRLYIDSGLVAPTRESSYTGRSSIHFSEADVAVLETVATLRQAGFSIGDIKTMLDTPGEIPEVLAAHRERLAAEIAEREAILRTLSGLDDPPPVDCTQLAALLRQATAPSKLPRWEDLSMSMQEIKRMIRGRIPNLFALLAALVGCINLWPLAVKTAFAKLEVVPGGGFDMTLRPGLHPPLFAVLAFLPAILLTAGTVLFFVDQAGNRRGWLLVALGCTAASALTLLLLPEDVRMQMYTFEFLQYRFSVMYHIAYSASRAFDYVIMAGKFIPHLLAAVFGCIGLRRAQ